MKTNLSYPENLTRYFGEKSHHGLLWSWWHSRRRQVVPKCYPEVISKLIGVNFRKSPGNINYSTFSPEWTKLCNMHQEKEKFNLFSAGSGFTDQIFTGEVSRVDSNGALRQDVLSFYLIFIFLCSILSNGDWLISAFERSNLFHLFLQQAKRFQ